MKEYGAALQNQPVDVSEEFSKQQNHFFVGSKVSEFDPDAASGKILWKHLALKQRVSYHQLTLQFEDYKVSEDTPPDEYEDYISDLRANPDNRIGTGVGDGNPRTNEEIAETIAGRPS